MKAHTFTIDAGHGGSDPGAVSNGYKEEDLNLKVSKLLNSALIRCGQNTIMTRDTDKSLSLRARGQLAKKANSTALISVHFNAASAEAKGFEVLYSYFNEKNCKDISKKLAENILKEAISLGMYNRGIKTKESGSMPGRNYFGVLRNAEPIPSVIVEGLFLTSKSDIQFLKDEDFLKNLAEAYAKGICKTFDIAYMSPAGTVSEPKKPPIKKVEPTEHEKNIEIMMSKFKDPDFKDYNQVSEYAKEAVKNLWNLGIITGNNDKEFNPKSHYTKQDIAVILNRLLKRIKILK